MHKLHYKFIPRSHELLTSRSAKLQRTSQCYTGWPNKYYTVMPSLVCTFSTLFLRKKGCCRILAITLPNLDRFSKYFHCSGMKFPTKPVQNCQHSLMVLLHYLVKCITHYYCTVNNMFYVVPNDQQTLLQFIDILNTQLVDMLLMMPQIVYATRLRSGLSEVVI